jgi:hypothetical protein
MKHYFASIVFLALAQSMVFAQGKGTDTLFIKKDVAWNAPSFKFSTFLIFPLMVSGDVCLTKDAFIFTRSNKKPKQKRKWENLKLEIVIPVAKIERVRRNIFGELVVQTKSRKYRFSPFNAYESKNWFRYGRGQALGNEFDKIVEIISARIDNVDRNGSE